MRLGQQSILMKYEISDKNANFLDAFDVLISFWIYCAEQRSGIARIMTSNDGGFQY